MTKTVYLALLGLTLAACQTTQATGPDPITEAVSGKTLISPRGEIFNIGSDGSLTGLIGENKDIELLGTWAVKNGQWCRTITAPAQIAGDACQEATLNDDGTITIVGGRGPVAYAIQ